MPENLNPEALEAACVGFYQAPQVLTSWQHLCAADPALADKYRAGMRAAVSAYFAALLSPRPGTIEGVYDIGTPEPDNVDQVIECDEHGNPYERDPEGNNDFTWSKTIDGTRWKGYKDGKEYRDWDDLVRRYGPVKAVTTEGGRE